MAITRVPSMYMITSVAVSTTATWAQVISLSWTSDREPVPPLRLIASRRS